MKQYLVVLVTFFSLHAWAQQDTTKPHPVAKHAAFTRHSTIATVSVGFADAYRQSYGLPEGYQKGNTSGFAPLYAKLEYAVSRNISVAATLGYDAFVYNFYQNYTGNTGAFTRARTDDMRLYAAGVSGYYHLGSLIRVRSLDPFIGVGVSLNNLRYSSYPQGDSSVINLTHPITVSLRAGARYYLSQQFSLFGDVGYDKQSVFSLGLSCRFFQTRKRPVKELDSDGDGVPDRIDSCPHQKGLAVFNGCPDTDGDGIPDNQDACPTVAGPAENHGCPYDNVKNPVVTPVVTQRQVTVPKNIIQFQPATAELKDSSIIILDSIVKVMKGNSKMDIAIQSYSDAAHGQPVSKKIANARAVAVKKYLTDRGIVASRLVFITGQHDAEPLKAKKHRDIMGLRYDLTY